MRPRTRGLVRLAAALAILLGFVVVVSLAFGALAHVSSRHAISAGLYLVGALILAIGFFHGVRPPVRTEAGGRSLQGGMFGILFSAGTVRSATADEHRDSHQSAALFIGLALVLIVLGALIDPTHRLY